MNMIGAMFCNAFYCGKPGCFGFLGVFGIVKVANGELSDIISLSKGFVIACS